MQTSKPMNIGITGASGLVGTALTESLAHKGYHLTIFQRHRGLPKSTSSISYAFWDYERNEIDKPALAKIDAMIHLAGAGVADKRWTVKRKKVLVESRVNATDFLVKNMVSHSHNCKTFIAASAIGYYKESKPNDAPHTENDAADDSFLGRLCQQWEEASAQISSAGISRCIIRIGHVLSLKGGALPKLVQPVRKHIVAIMGEGKQLVSWIHLDDLVNLLCYVLEHPSVQGVYNAVAPEVVSQKEEMKAIQKALNVSALSLHIPETVLKILLGEFSVELLKSANVSSSKIEEHGFEFTYPTLQNALEQLLTKAS